MSKEDLKPELSMEQQFERWLKTARAWIAQRATVLLLGAVAVVIVVAAIVFSVKAKDSAQLAVINTIEEAQQGLRMARVRPNDDAAKTEVFLDGLERAGERAQGTPLYAYALLSTANALYDAGEYENALGTYDRILREAAENYLARAARMGRAATLDALDRRADAEAAYKRIIADLPNTFFATRAADRLKALAGPPVALPPASMPAASVPAENKENS